MRLLFIPCIPASQSASLNIKALVEALSPLSNISDLFRDISRVSELESKLFCYRYQSNTGIEVLNSILNIQPKDVGGGGGETRETVVYKMAEDMLSKLPPDYKPHEVHSLTLLHTHH